MRYPWWQLIRIRALLILSLCRRAPALSSKCRQRDLFQRDPPMPSPGLTQYAPWACLTAWYWCFGWFLKFLSSGFSKFWFYDHFCEIHFFSPKSPDPAQLRAKEGRQIRRETCFFRIQNHEKSIPLKSETFVSVMFPKIPGAERAEIRRWGTFEWVLQRQEAF